MLRFRNEGYALHKVRSRISWFVKAMNTRAVSCKPLNMAIRTAPDAASVNRVLDEFLAGEHRLFPKSQRESAVESD